MQALTNPIAHITTVQGVHTAKMASAAALCVALLALLVPASMARVPPALQRINGGMDACGTCKLAMRVLSDALCDESVDDSMAKWVIDNVCPQMGDKKQCAELVIGMAPMVIDWIRSSASPEVMCRDAGVCAANTLQLPAAKPTHLVRRASRSNDVTCPLCTFVVSTVQQQLSDPITQQEIHDKSMQACSALPAGEMRDTCVSFVEQYEATIFNFINTMSPMDICAMLGTCLDARLAAAAPLAPLQPTVVTALAPLVAALQQAPSSAVPNDKCDTCKVVIMEMHQVVANPNVQAQLVDYAKQACGLIQSLATQCQADVDQYAPMVFGMALAYLQPEQVCVQLNLCPAPSAVSFQQLVKATLGVKGLLDGKYRQYSALLKAPLDS